MCYLTPALSFLYCGRLLLSLGLAQYLHDEGPQFFERLKAHGLEGHHVLYPALPVSLLDFRLGMDLQGKGTVCG